MGDLADTDVVALVRRFLLSRDPVTAELGGEGRVGATNKPPYPRVRLTDPPGDDRTLTHLIAPLVQVEVYGDPGATGQKPALRRVLYRVLQELAGLPEAQALGEFPIEAGEPVCTSVTSTGGGGWLPEPTGQPRYLATIRLHVHPQTS